MLMLLMVFFVGVRCRSPGGDAAAQASAPEESVLFLGGDEHCYAGGFFRMHQFLDLVFAERSSNP